LRRQNRACILAFVLRVLQCNLHFLTSCVHCADRLSSVLLLLHSIRVQGPACRSRPTADGLEISTPVLQVSSRLSCHRKCSQNTALQAFLVLSGTCSAYSTLSQFLTGLSRNSVILRRHKHGRPVSRRKSDLQGPNSAAVLRDRDFSVQIFICPRFHLNCDCFKEGARYRD
jgi:hypothetical protein